MALYALLKIEGTVPAYPLGRPVDGRDRFGMTRDQARLYRWLVQNKPHSQSFTMNFRDIAARLGKEFHSRTHDHAVALVERGWLQKDGERYQLVEPIKYYPEPHIG